MTYRTEESAEYCVGLFHRPGSLFSDFKTNLSTSYICGDYFTPLPPARTWAMHKNRGFYHLATFWVLGFLLKNISKALQILIQVVDFLQDKCTHRDRISHSFTVCTRSSSQPFPWIHLIHLRNLCTGIKGRNHRAWLFCHFYYPCWWYIIFLKNIRFFLNSCKSDFYNFT